MFSRVEWFVAFRYLLARRRDKAISIIAGFSLLGISLGVATLIIVMAVMNGFREELLGGILGLDGQVQMRSVNGGITDYDALAGRVRQVDGVLEVTPLIKDQVMATSTRRASGSIVWGMTPEDLAKKTDIVDGLVAGDVSLFHGNDSVFMGAKLAERLGLFPGDRVTLISPQGTATPFGTAPRMRGFEVTGLFTVGMYQYDEALIVVPLEAAQAFFRLPDQVNQIDIWVEDPDASASYEDGIYEAAAGAPIYVNIWQDLHQSYFNALNVERNVMFIILVLIILIAALNIWSGLVMLVKDKGRDIAILRSMGATAPSVMRIFFICGSMVGVIGTLVGFGLGMLFISNITAIQRGLETLLGTRLFNEEVYFLTTLPAKSDPVENTIIVVAALTISFLATLAPARRAARLDPVEALRYE